jgi:tetratricopeptide (TPR) repeat protein
MRVLGWAAFTAAALLAALIGNARAQTATTTIGPGPAERCYVSARDGASGLVPLQECTAALGGFLSEADRAATLTNRAVLRLQRREGAMALADLDAALALRPERGEAHVNRGAALILLGRFEEALAAIDQGLALNAADPHEAYFNRGIAHEALDNLPAAYRDYARAAALAPDWPLPQAELARFTVRTP